MPDAGNGGTIPALGRLESVPLREIWAREDTDFTPWLADGDNLSLLGDTLQLGNLQVQGTEVPVGNCFIDILARDIEGRIVVIENQFGPTDHTHLGQFLTYVAGQEGQATVIWIAEKIREEHRAAIDWLNAATVEDFDFFAVEIEALRIADSPVAPRFNVVAKPNNWTRGLGRATRAAASAPPDERQKAYMAYWSRFAEFLKGRQAPFRMPDSLPRSTWCGFGHIGRRGYTLTATSSLAGPKRAVGLYIAGQVALAECEPLWHARDEIEDEFGAALDWRRNPKSVAIEIIRFDLAGKPEDEQFIWFVDQMERFERVFRPRIESLPADSGSTNGVAPPADLAADG